MSKASISQKITIGRLPESMPEQIAACIAAEAGSTIYLYKMLARAVHVGSLTGFVNPHALLGWTMAMYVIENLSTTYM